MLALLALMPAIILTPKGDIKSDASDVVILREERDTVMTFWPYVSGKSGTMTIVVPLPAPVTKDDIKVVPADPLERITAFDAPRIGEIWEQDPCAERRPALGVTGIGEGGGGFEDNILFLVTTRFAPSPYTVELIKGRDPLYSWMKRHSLPLPTDAQFAPYEHFVTLTTTYDGKAERLAPFRVHFVSDDLELPLALSAVSSTGTHHTTLHILSRTSRFDAGTAPPADLLVTKEALSKPDDLHAATIDPALKNGLVSEYIGEATSCGGLTCASHPPDIDDLMCFGADVVPHGQRDAVYLRTSLNMFDRPAWVEEAPLRGCVTSGWVTMTVSSNGGAVTAAVKQSNVANPGEEDCVKDALQKMKAPSGSVDLTFTYARAWPLNTPSWVLTRLHAKTTKGARPTVLKTAPVKQVTELKAVAAQYVIKHPWTTAVTCDAPDRGRWGALDLEHRHDVQPKPILRSPFGNASLATKSLIATEPQVVDAGVAPAQTRKGCGCTTTPTGPNLSLVLLVLISRMRRRSDQGPSQ